MRKRKKQNRKIFPFILIILIISVFLGVGYSILREQLTINGEVTINGKPNTSPIPDKKDLEVTFLDNSSTPGIYQYGLNIKNITTQTSKGWTIYIIVPSDTVLANNYGCNAKIENSVLIITNTYNGSINPGGSLNWEVGITIKTTSSISLPFEYASEIVY